MLYIQNFFLLFELTYFTYSHLTLFLSHCPLFYPKFYSTSLRQLKVYSETVLVFYVICGWHPLSLMWSSYERRMNFMWNIH